MTHPENNSDLKIHTEPEYFHKAYGSDIEQLKKVKDVFNKTIEHNNSVLFTQVKLFFPEFQEFPEDNKVLEAFLKKLAERLSKQRQYFTIFWVRFNDFYRSHQSYGLILLSDSYFANRASGLQSLCRHFWLDTLKLDQQTKNLFDYCITKPHSNNFILNLDDLYFDMHFYQAMDVTAQMIILPNETREGIEPYGFCSNCVDISKLKENEKEQPHK